MLLANMSVAAIISDAFADKAMLRRHPPPNERKMQGLCDACRGLVCVDLPACFAPVPACCVHALTLQRHLLGGR